MRIKEREPGTEFIKLEPGETAVGRVMRHVEGKAYGPSYLLNGVAIRRGRRFEVYAQLGLGENTSLAGYRLDREIGQIVGVSCVEWVKTQVGRARVYKVVVFDSAREAGQWATKAGAAAADVAALHQMWSEGVPEAESPRTEAEPERNDGDDDDLPF